MIISHDEKERAVFRSRRMAETDRLSDLATARDKGRREGDAARAISVARAMLSDGEPATKIARYTGLSFEDVEKLRI